MKATDGPTSFETRRMAPLLRMRGETKFVVAKAESVPTIVAPVHVKVGTAQVRFCPPYVRCSEAVP